MLTVDALEGYGANTKEGLSRCLNNESFYLKLVKKAAESDEFEKLQEAIGSGDLDRAFEIAHSLKGVTGNLSLTPVFQPVVEMTELLRSRDKKTDYTAFLAVLRDRVGQLRTICKD